MWSSLWIWDFQRLATSLVVFGIRDLSSKEEIRPVLRPTELALQVVSVKYRKAKGNHAGMFRFLLVCTGINHSNTMRIQGRYLSAFESATFPKERLYSQGICHLLKIHP